VTKLLDSVIYRLEKHKEALAVFDLSVESDHNFQRTPGTAKDFHIRAAKVMKEHDIKTVLDIGCGFNDICDECCKLGIDAFGIDPIVDKHSLRPDRIYRGTIGSAMKTIFKDEFMVDCIVCTNFIHSGAYNHLKIFLDCITSHSKFILVSPPNYGTCDMTYKEKIDNAKAMVKFMDMANNPTEANVYRKYIDMMKGKTQGENLESFCEEYGYKNIHDFGKTHSGLVKHYLLRKTQ